VGGMTANIIRLPAPPDTTPLRERDVEFLQVRAIDPAVAAERGYTTAPGNLGQLGFSQTQAELGAGLLIPVHTVDGEVAYPLFRPDTPRRNDNGKAGPKYEVPAGQSLVIDAHPRIRHQLGNPTVPLLICESAPKADACISLGYVAISVNGVWGWRHTNEYDGKTIVPCFEKIALNGRRVVIAFDSDAWTNPDVADAVERLGRWHDRKAKVLVLRIPPPPEDKKQGIDDFIASGGDLDALIADAVPFGRFLEERPRRSEPESEPDDNDAAAWKARYEAERNRRRAAEKRHSDVVQIINNPSFSPAESVAYLRAQFEYERLASAGKTDGRRATLYLPELAKTIYTDRHTGRVLDDGEVYERRQRKELDTTAAKHQSMAPATISKALRTVAERSKAFVIAEMPDPKTGKPRLTMEPLHATTRETMEAVALAFVQVDRRRGKHKPKDPRLATIEPCAECGADTDVVIKADAYCTSCGDHLGALPDERIAAPFQNETESPALLEDPSSPSPHVLKTLKTKRSDVDTGFWTARERHFAEPEPDEPPFQTETVPMDPVLGLCSDCRRPLRNAEERAFGRHSYDCTTPTPTRVPSPSAPLFAMTGDD